MSQMSRIWLLSLLWVTLVQAQLPRRLVAVTHSESHAHWSHLDILRGDSHKDADGDLHLHMLIHSEAELHDIQRLQDEGILTVATSTKDRRLEDERDWSKVDFEREFPCYRTVAQTFESIDTLVQRYPTLARKDFIGPSHLQVTNDDGYDIPVLILSNQLSPTPKAPMLIVAGQHPRELTPVESVMRYAEQLLQGYDTNADATWILDRTEIHIVPIGNPDTRALVQDNLQDFLRKNRHDYGCRDDESQAVGVDLNRNFPMFYGRNSGSSDDRCRTNYRGPTSLSEVEASNFFAYAVKLFPRYAQKNIEDAESRQDEACPETNPGIFIDVHSAGELLFFPWGHEDVDSPNADALTTMASKLASFGDYELWGPGQPGFLYPVSGDTVDSMYGILCVPSFGYELGTRLYESCDDYDTRVLPVVIPSLVYATKCASAGYNIPRGPDVLGVSFEDRTRALRAFVSDSERSINSQTIVTVRVFIDQHPYDEGSVGIDMIPDDGFFDTDTESASLILNVGATSSPQQRLLQSAPRRYTVYIEAEDSSGFKGPVEALFVELQEDIVLPTANPTMAPARAPIGISTRAPKNAPTTLPTRLPTKTLTGSPTSVPTSAPTTPPIVDPTSTPTQALSGTPNSAAVTLLPTGLPYEFMSPSSSPFISSAGPSESSAFPTRLQSPSESPGLISIMTPGPSSLPIDQVIRPSGLPVASSVAPSSFVSVGPSLQPMTKDTVRPSKSGLSPTTPLATEENPSTEPKKVDSDKSRTEAPVILSRTSVSHVHSWIEQLILFCTFLAS